MSRSRSQSNHLAWGFIVVLALFCLPLTWPDSVSSVEAVEEVAFTFSDMERIEIGSGLHGMATDTLFQGDSLTFSYGFDTITRNIDWVHALNLHIAGGDSAGIDSVNVYLSTDRTNFFKYGSAILTTTPNDTTITFTIPMAPRIRLRFYCFRVSRDTTIISGYYIFR